MNANRVINMVIRQIMRRAMGKGMSMASKKMSGGAGKPVPGQRETQKRAQQGMRAMRRIGRF